MNISKILDEYLQIFSDEAAQLGKQVAQANNQSEAELINRKNNDGHFTASAFVMCQKTGRLLLLEHKSLGRLLQPGGHIDDADNSPLEAAYRELEEETGINRKLLKSINISPDNELVPFDVDVHFIPANPKKPEDEHYHYDFRYLFTIKDEFSVNINGAESTDFKWVDLHDFALQPGSAFVAGKTEKLVNN